jgi:tetratricopeptide (TPR) repeat protein
MMASIFRLPRQMYLLPIIILVNLVTVSSVCGSVPASPETSFIAGTSRYVKLEAQPRDTEQNTEEANSAALFERDLELAIEAFYMTDWQTFRRLIIRLKQQEATDLRLHFFESMVPFWAYFFAGNQSEDANQFLLQSAKAIQLGDQHLKETPSDTSAILLMGGLHGYRSLVAASQRQYRTAISSGVSGYSFTKVLLAMDNSDPNTLMGQGVFEYMVGSIPREVRWMASLAGLTGSKDNGYALLEQASVSGSYVSNDASMFLAYFYEQDARFDDALRHLNRLALKYPQNVIFRYNIARMHELKGEVDKARLSYLMVREMRNQSVPVLSRLSYERLEALGLQRTSN